jgi:hypothetical protein
MNEGVAVKHNHSCSAAVGWLSKFEWEISRLAGVLNVPARFRTRFAVNSRRKQEIKSIESYCYRNCMQLSGPKTEPQQWRESDSVNEWSSL